MKENKISKRAISVNEHPKYTRYVQPILVAELKDYHLIISRPVEQDIVCPRCHAVIATMSSYRRLLAYKAPVGDYGIELGMGIAGVS